jgi:rhamnose utilization protein RhaD (predicted bifunctional aldolase and dehydrogenase)
MSNDIRATLLTLSQNLGKPENDYAILGEGNTSAQIDEETFWVKASGQSLRTLQPEGVVKVRFDAALAMLNGPDLSDDETRAALAAAKADPQTPGHPSVETTFHAVCLQLPDVNFVGHTHPTVINQLTCSAAFETAISGRLFPDEIVLCGVMPLVVPYVDPGLPLARELHRRLYEYIDTYGERPKVILLQNHGLIALAPTAEEIENIHAMAVKAARTLQGTYALGGPHFLTPEAVSRIHTRPDEHYRQKIIGASVPKSS